MADPPKLYTRTGDDGTTSLVGGQRVSKSALRIEAYGTVDELNSQLGAALAHGLCDDLRQPLTTVQGELFELGSELALMLDDLERFRLARIEEPEIAALEGLIDRLTASLEPLTNFILPGGSAGASHLHLARTVCRRAERLAVRLASEEGLRDEALRYLNRLSDALFVMARYENQSRGVADVLWRGGDRSPSSS